MTTFVPALDVTPANEGQGVRRKCLLLDARLLGHDNRALMADEEHSC